MSEEESGHRLCHINGPFYSIYILKLVLMGNKVETVFSEKIGLYFEVNLLKTRPFLEGILRNNSGENWLTLLTTFERLYGC